MYIEKKGKVKVKKTFMFSQQEKIIKPWNPKIKFIDNCDLSAILHWNNVTDLEILDSKLNADIKSEFEGEDGELNNENNTQNISQNINQNISLTNIQSSDILRPTESKCLDPEIVGQEQISVYLSKINELRSIEGKLKELPIRRNKRYHFMRMFQRVKNSLNTFDKIVNLCQNNVIKSLYLKPFIIDKMNILIEENNLRNYDNLLESDDEDYVESEKFEPIPARSNRYIHVEARYLDFVENNQGNIGNKTIDDFWVEIKKPAKANSSMLPVKRASLLQLPNTNNLKLNANLPNRAQRNSIIGYLPMNQFQQKTPPKRISMKPGSITPKSGSKSPQFTPITRKSKNFTDVVRKCKTLKTPKQSPKAKSSISPHTDVVVPFKSGTKKKNSKKISLRLKPLKIVEDIGDAEGEDEVKAKVEVEKEVAKNENTKKTQTIGINTQLAEPIPRIVIEGAQSPKRSINLPLSTIIESKRDIQNDKQEDSQSESVDLNDSFSHSSLSSSSISSNNFSHHLEPIVENGNINNMVEELRNEIEIKDDVKVISSENENKANDNSTDENITMKRIHFGSNILNSNILNEEDYIRNKWEIIEESPMIKENKSITTKFQARLKNIFNNIHYNRKVAKEPIQRKDLVAIEQFELPRMRKTQSNKSKLMNQLNRSGNIEIDSQNPK